MLSLLVQQRFYESTFDAELNSHPPFGSVNILKCDDTPNALLGRPYLANFMILTWANSRFHLRKACDDDDFGC